MRQFVCLRIAPAGEIKGSAFIFRVNGLKVVGQKRKVGKGGTENGPAILPIVNSFEYFVW
jgi:hypothetical protein